MSKLKSKLYPDIFKDWKMHELSEWKTVLLSRLKEKLEQKDKMFTMLQLSEVERSIGNRKEAASWLDKCFPYYSKYGQAEHKGMLFFIKGHLLMLSGLYDESLVSALNGLRYFMQTDNHEYIARSHRLCANICGWLGLFEESMEYHEKSIAEALITGESDFVGDCMLRQNETKMSLLKSVSVVGDFLETIAYMQQVKKGGDSHTEADALTVLCSLYIYADDLDSAKKALARSKEMKQRLGTTGRAVTYTVMEGDICAKEGDEKGMLAAFNEMGKTYEDGKCSLTNRLMSFRTCILFYLHKKDADKARTYIDQQQKLLDKAGPSPTLSDYVAEVMIGYYALIEDHKKETKYLREHYEHQIKTLQQITTKRLKHLSLIHELEQSEKENEMMKRDLNHTTQELDLSNHYLQQRNELLNDLKDCINGLKKENAQREVVFQTLFKRIDVAFNKEDSDRPIFKEKFDQTHSAYIHGLSKQYPQLSPSECRICAMLHSGFNTKDIGTLTSTTQRNIEAHRLNIRKKMGLSRSQNLQTILASIKV